MTGIRADMPTQAETPQRIRRSTSRWTRALVLVMLGLMLAPFVLGAGSPATAEQPRAKASRDGSDRDESGEGSKSGQGAGLVPVPALSRGVESILAQVREREVELVLREQAVAERERTVAELEQRIDQRARELDRIRAEVEDRIHAWASQGGDRIAQLAKVYSEMPEQKAGNLLARLDLDLAVSVIRQMKKKSSAGVLAAMPSERALLVSERLLKPLDPTTDAPAAPQP